LFVVFFGQSLHTQFNVRISNFMVVKNAFDEFESVRTERVTEFAKYLLKSVGDNERRDKKEKRALIIVLCLEFAMSC